MRRWAERGSPCSDSADGEACRSVCTESKRRSRGSSRFRQVFCERGLLLLPPFLLSYGTIDPTGSFVSEMGSALSVSCQRAHAGRRGPPWSAVHPTERISHGVMERTAHGVYPARRAARGEPLPQEWFQASSVRSRTVRACVPSQAQAVARRSSHRHRTPAVGQTAGRVRDEDLDSLLVGRAQPGPQGRRCGALIEEGPRRGYR